MAELSIEEKVKLASKFIEQTPPGEINDVINDIRTIIANDEALMPQVIPALRDYNLTQLQVVEHQASDTAPVHSSVLSHAAILPGSEEGNERYADAEGKRSFAFDHVTLAVSDYQPYELPEEEETFRAELAKSLSAYAKNHFPSGFSSVSSSQFPLLPPAPEPPVVPAPVADESTETPNPTEAESSEPIVTDVVEEQVGTGEVEPVPTPAVEGVSTKLEEVDQEGGLEKVDELVEEAKEEEEREEAGEKADGNDTPKVEEDTLEDGKEVPVSEVSKVDETIVEAPEETVAAPVQVEERKQERVENPIYTLEIVGNRYNPNNFWTGRWRTQWIVDKAAESVSGSINVDVHYYEQGNVQLATQHKASFPLPTEPNGSQSVASQIVTTISKIETNYHLELNDVYGELGDKAFRALRRALPVTRQKMDWEKVSGYSLGSDLTKARG
ncbi:hypothetical protein CI109_100550 [Kwoniella shandongensis]|uniref:Uncharacterized protein n=1 Tax=Kwoniella shandongensis TaxID=1734106 RepID=A0A5M6C0Z3_9TREE|nr:uncharacterized protein CI109_003529 [Kwoniella shandongensis]KAA5528240.1 hypothetical protein CI109_003529 [Kwoniella shandongensis]